jgi:hypothetical protein
VVSKSSIAPKEGKVSKPSFEEPKSESESKLSISEKELFELNEKSN